MLQLIIWTNYRVHHFYSPSDLFIITTLIMHLPYQIPSSFFPKPIPPVAMSHHWRRFPTARHRHHPQLSFSSYYNFPPPTAVSRRHNRQFLAATFVSLKPEIDNFWIYIGQETQLWTWKGWQQPTTHNNPTSKDN